MSGCWYEMGMAIGQDHEMRHWRKGQGLAGRHELSEEICLMLLGFSHHWTRELAKAYNKSSQNTSSLCKYKRKGRISG